MGSVTKRIKRRRREREPVANLAKATKLFQEGTTAGWLRSVAEGIRALEVLGEGDLKDAYIRSERDQSGVLFRFCDASGQARYQLEVIGWQDDTIENEGHTVHTLRLVATLLEDNE